MVIGVKTGRSLLIGLLPMPVCATLSFHLNCYLSLLGKYLRSGIIGLNSESDCIVFCIRDNRMR